MDEKVVSPTYSKKVLVATPDVVKSEAPKSEENPFADREVEKLEEKAIQEKQAEQLDTPEEEKVRPEDINPNEPLFHAVADYLDITDQRDYSDAVPKVKYIVDFIVNEYGSDKYEDVITKLSDIVHAVVKPDFGVKLYKHIYRYVRLLETERAAKKARQAWEGKRWSQVPLERLEPQENGN